MDEVISLFQKIPAQSLLGVFICIVGFILVVRVASIAIKVFVFVIGIGLILRGAGFGKYADSLFAICSKAWYYVWDQLSGILSNIMS